MIRNQSYVFPDEQRRGRDKARRYAWRSIVLIAITGVILYVTTGHSQTMKTAWVTDALSMLPSFALIVALRYELKPPNERFPYGHFRAISVCFLLTATVLLSMGLWLFIEAALKLLAAERPPIGSMFLFGHPVWAGWPMIAALTLSMVVGMYAGKIKQPVAEQLHSKAIEAESATNRNEWMSEGAGILGILLVGFGFWWADAAAAALISIQIVWDGWESLRQVIADLMDEAPSRLGNQEMEPLPGRVKAEAERMPWVRQAEVRLREHGHLITGEIFVVPNDEHQLVSRIEAAVDALSRIDWRLHSLVMMPVSSIEDRPAPEP